MRRAVVLASVLLAVFSVAASVHARDTSTGLKTPTAAVPLPGGGFLVADPFDCTVKKGADDGTLTPFAGVSGSCDVAFAAGSQATAAHIGFPTTAVPVQDGTLIGSFGFAGGCQVEKVTPAGTITTVAGTGTCGNTGDGGPATAAAISFISIVPFHAPGAAVDTPDHGFLLAGGCSVRKVEAGVISTVAGGPCPEDPQVLNAVSCVPGLCTAAGGHGKTHASTAPATRDSWVFRQPAPTGTTFNGASCPTTSVCALSTIGGDVYVSSNPSATTPSWTATHLTASNVLGRSVTCLSATLCVYGDGNGDLYVSTNPTAASPTWTPSSVDVNTTSIVASACPSASLCVAAGTSGKVFSSTAPGSGTPDWKVKTVSGSGLDAVACPTETLCVAGGSDGKVYTSANAASGAASTWTPTATQVTTGEIDSLSCPSTTLCVGVDSLGNSLTSTNPAGGSWTLRNIHGTSGLRSVSCASQSQCVAVGGTDRLITLNPGDASPTWETTNAFNPQLSGVAATYQPINSAQSAVPTADGGFLIAETSANRIRKVSPGGIVTIVAGNGTAGYGGDGGGATAAQLNAPTSAVPTPDGGFLIADTGNCLVRKVLGGTITTVAGVVPSGGTAQCSAAGGIGQATAVKLNSPTAAVPFADGSFLIAGYSGTSGTDSPLPLVKPDGSLVSAVDPGAMASPSPSPSPVPSASPVPSGSASPSPAPSASASPVPTVTLGVATCALSAGPAKVKTALAPVARCTVPTALTVTAKVKLKHGKKTKTVRLSGRATAKANTPVTVAIKLSKTVTKAIKKGSRASVTLTLSSPGGFSAKAAIAKLKLKR